MDWLPLVTNDQLEEINQRSFDPSLKGVMIFKHSTRCSTSSMALNKLERNWDLSNTVFPIYFLDLLKFPSLSSTIAMSYNIRHESPQVLVIRNGKCIYTASHSSIRFDEIKDL